jgi:hypothetical protein
MKYLHIGIRRATCTIYYLRDHNLPDNDVSLLQGFDVSLLQGFLIDCCAVFLINLEDNFMKEGFITREI